MNRLREVLLICVVLALVSVGMEAAPSSTPTVPETRCGWFENPTPANSWLTDRDGEWIIAVQGGYQADGDWPDFKDNQWIKTNVNYGHGCACMKVATDRVAMRILKIFTASAKAPFDLQKGEGLKGKEPSRN